MSTKFKAFAKVDGGDEISLGLLSYRGDDIPGLIEFVLTKRPEFRTVSVTKLVLKASNQDLPLQGSIREELQKLGCTQDKPELCFEIRTSVRGRSAPAPAPKPLAVEIVTTHAHGHPGAPHETEKGHLSSMNPETKVKQQTTRFKVFAKVDGGEERDWGLMSYPGDDIPGLIRHVWQKRTEIRTGNVTKLVLKASNQDLPLQGSIREELQKLGCTQDKPELCFEIRTSVRGQSAPAPAPKPPAVEIVTTHAHGHPGAPHETEKGHLSSMKPETKVKQQITKFKAFAKVDGGDELSLGLFSYRGDDIPGLIELVLTKRPEFRSGSVTKLVLKASNQELPLQGSIREELQKLGCTQDKPELCFEIRTSVWGRSGPAPAPKPPAVEIVTTHAHGHPGAPHETEKGHLSPSYA